MDVSREFERSKPIEWSLGSVQGLIKHGKERESRGVVGKRVVPHECMENEGKKGVGVMTVGS